ncbi:MAG: hypothetical protein QNJ58_16375 [Desulfobacterales bacterium]|nr:hypothetical protein [Desulfobacterales bacterium]
MSTIITESHSELQVNVRGIVDRILRFQKPETIEDLNEIALLDNSIDDRGFGCYRKSDRRIEIYLDPILKWQPWILKKTYLFPFITVAMTLAHELDHHVNRDNAKIDREQSAERNMFNYIYPALGVFEPIMKFIHHLSHRLKKQG